MKFEKYKECQQFLEAGNQILKQLERYDQEIEKSHCDKHGIGFNIDDRFSSAEIKITVCGWLGYYGNSGCCTVPFVRDIKTFTTAFIRHLNKNFRQIMESVAKDIIAEFEAKRAGAIDELRDALNDLEGKQ